MGGGRGRDGALTVICGSQVVQNSTVRLEGRGGRDGRNHRRSVAQSGHLRIL